MCDSVCAWVCECVCCVSQRTTVRNGAPLPPQDQPLGHCPSSHWAQEACAQLTVLAQVLWLLRSFVSLCELRFLFPVLQMIFLGFWSWLCWTCRSLGIQKFKYWINSSDLWNDVFFRFPSHQPVLTFSAPTTAYFYVSDSCGCYCETISLIPLIQIIYSI